MCGKLNFGAYESGLYRGKSTKNVRWKESCTHGRFLFSSRFWVFFSLMGYKQLFSLLGWGSVNSFYLLVDNIVQAPVVQTWDSFFFRFDFNENYQPSCQGPLLFRPGRVGKDPGNEVGKLHEYYK